MLTAMITWICLVRVCPTSARKMGFLLCVCCVVVVCMMMWVDR